MNSVSDELCKNTTGLSKEEFQYLCGELHSLRNTQFRSIPQALAVYLFWLTTGLGQKKIATYFGTISQFDVARYLQQIRAGLSEKFVKENLGINHLSRDEWLKNNSKVATDIFCTDENQFVIVADGTYCYIQKSSNNYFQRKTYSVQKKRHLVKPFVVTASNGRIIDVYGLFEATKNDSSIFLEILEDQNGLKSLLREGDIVLVDRGFRDSIKKLEDVYKLSPKMPSMLSKNEKQLTTYEANYSRLITKCRWVVEVTNSFLKYSFPALNQVPNKLLLHTLVD